MSLKPVPGNGILQVTEIKMETEASRLLDYFSRISPLSDEEAKDILHSMNIKSFPKGTVLLREDEISRETFFVLRGCVRQYHLVDGDEKTNHFFTENQWVISINSLLQQKPAGHFWICMEDCVLVSGNNEREKELLAKHPRFENIARKVMELILAEHQQMLQSYYTETPEQRYTRLCNERKDLLQRVPQYHIASYLGITPESLSRIRKRLSSDK